MQIDILFYWLLKFTRMMSHPFRHITLEASVLSAFRVIVYDLKVSIGIIIPLQEWYLIYK